VLTALVVDDSAGARRRVGTMLHLGGWEVHQAVGTEAALSVAAGVALDLVVTDIEMRGGHGAALLHRLRNEGCRARSIVVAARPTEAVRAQAAAAGAFACLAKPVDPRLFLDLMHGLSGRPVPPRPAAQNPAVPAIHVEAERLDRVQAMYTSTLPGRLAGIAGAAQDGDALAVAAGAQALAEASEQVGRAEVAWVCRGIATDARRGVLSHSRLMQLVALSAASERGQSALDRQSTRSA
jgi:CheY-like chemotaxis protein